MERKSKIFFAVFFLLIIGAVGAAYYRIMIKRDYIIEAQTDCDPTAEKCFIWNCDPNAKDETEKCTGDPEKDTWYYKLSFRNAGRVGLCDPNKDEDCAPMACKTGEQECSEVFCDENTKKQYEQEADCNDPEEYLKNNPPEDESDSEECAPDDQACLDESSSDASSDESCDSAAGDTCSIDSEGSGDESSDSAEDTTESEPSSAAPAPNGTGQPLPAPTPVSAPVPAPVK